MSRSSGTYSPPVSSWYPTTTGASATKADWDALLADISAALTQSISADGQTPITANLPLGSFKLTGLGSGTARTDAMSFGQAQDGAYAYLTGVAGTNTITASLSTPSLAAYATGMVVRFIAAGANTGAVTLNINTLGAKAITKNGTTALTGGELVSGAVYDAVYDGTRFQLSATPSGALVDVTSVNNGPIAGFRNVVINGGFTVNQRAYVSAAVLASGSYGHDRWKGGASGGDYSFTQLASDTTITIAANKTLIQVIEDKNVQATSYVLSWTGTCTARYAVNSATPAGAYAASPILITGQTVGTTMSIEFGNGASSGTLGKVQLERGTATTQATSFEQRPFQSELMLCQRYYFRMKVGAIGEQFGVGFNNSTSIGQFHSSFPVQMRAAPSALDQSGTAADYSVYNAAGATVCTSVPAYYSGSVWGAGYRFTTAATLTAGQGCQAAAASTSAYLGWSAEL
jgi:hypothetical protein